MNLVELLLIANGLVSTTYGYGERMCGDIGTPAECKRGALTASGIPLEPSAPMAAIFAPTKMRLKAQWIQLRVPDRECKWVLLADKGNPRFIGERGFDLTPAAVELLTGESAHPNWSGKVEVCDK